MEIRFPQCWTRTGHNYTVHWWEENGEGEGPEKGEIAGGGWDCVGGVIDWRDFSAAC